MLSHLAPLVSQDVSIAGKRAGLNGSRSGLFFQAIRIIKEMRNATNGQYPRYAVYENVAGVQSSNDGEDFRTVLEEICKIKDSSISVPRPPRKWTGAGEIMEDNFSVAYRMLDASGWGVPQRRKRIYLVADFDGTSAGEILFKSEGMSGYTPQGFRAWEGIAGGAEACAGEASSRYCLNVQGQSGVSVTVDHTGTLVAQDHGNHPAVLESAGFCTEHSAKARSIGYEEETSPTLRAGVVPAALLFENHSADTRYRGPLDISPTLSATLGMGGNNQPFVVENSKGFDVRFTSSGTRNARSNVYETDTARTIDTAGNSPDSNQGGAAVCEPRAYGICAKHSNSMLSDNPHSGFYEADTARTIDTSDQSPIKNQGGMCVVSPETYALQGSMIGRAEKNGPQGSGINEGVCFTLNCTDHHAVAAPEGGHYSTSKNSHHTVASYEQANTLVASDWKDPPLVNDTSNDEPIYIVRRLTPTECARLQGLPDWWCKNLDNQNPTDEDIAFWKNVWDEWTSMNGKKQKSESQIRKWLTNPYSDSAEYKLYGNGIAVPCGYFVLSGIAWVAQNSNDNAANCERSDTM